MRTPTTLSGVLASAARYLSEEVPDERPGEILDEVGAEVHSGVVGATTTAGKMLGERPDEMLVEGRVGVDGTKSKKADARRSEGNAEVLSCPGESPICSSGTVADRHGSLTCAGEQLKSSSGIVTNGSLRNALGLVLAPTSSDREAAAGNDWSATGRSGVRIVDGAGSCTGCDGNEGGKSEDDWGCGCGCGDGGARACDAGQD